MNEKAKPYHFYQLWHCELMLSYINFKLGGLSAAILLNVRTWFLFLF